jgi:hypothetical protein
MPNWDELIAALGAHLKEETYPNKDWSIKSFCHAEEKHDHKQAGQIYRDSQIHYNSKQEHFTRLLIDEKTPSDVHIDLIRIGFSGFFTSNFDHLLEDAFAYLHGKTLLSYFPSDFDDPNFRFGENFFVTKLHGDAARWNSVIIGEGDYQKPKWVAETTRLVAGKTLGDNVIRNS